MDRLEFEHLEPDSNEESTKKADESIAIELSNKIIKALDEKVKEHNGENPDQKVTLSQLKKVYRRGAKSRGEEKGLWAMARVNMFLRMKTGENIALANKDKPVRIDTYIDISASWSPSENDFLSAKEEIEKYGLSNFNSVDDLYLEDYTKMDRWISY